MYYKFMPSPNLKRHLKNYLILAGYLVFFVFGPFVIVNNNIDHRHTRYWVGLLDLFVLFVSPFLFAIPYKLSQLKSVLEKVFFVTLGLVIPFLFIYVYVYLDILKNFHPGF